MWHLAGRNNGLDRLRTTWFTFRYHGRSKLVDSEADMQEHGAQQEYGRDSKNTGDDSKISGARA
jgi:hypothetical protein